MPDPTTTHFRESLDRVEEAIADACRRANRPRREVELMAVSKTYPASTILEAASLGLRLFGENRVQEFAGKAGELAGLRSAATANPANSANPAISANSASVFHLIGHLQSNKAAKAAELFDAIDSVDSFRLAERLNEAAARLNKRLPVLIEVKLSDEETKAGIDPESAEAAVLLESLPDLSHLEVRGLMTIAPLGVADEITHGCFRSLRQCRDRWAQAHSRLNFDVLSMGMSGDFPIAIEEGATRIRIGTALFGKRPPMAVQRQAYPEDFAE